MRIFKLFLLFIAVTLLMLQADVLCSNSKRYALIKRHQQPFSFLRRMKWKCIKTFHKAGFHANYYYHVLSFEARYKALTLIDNIVSIYKYGTNKNILMPPPPPLGTGLVQSQTYPQLTAQLSPYEKKVANRLLLQWYDNSVKISNYFVKKIKEQAGEWEVLVRSWNAPLKLSEKQQPYHYQPEKRDQKLASLLLQQNLRMMRREIDLLYLKHFHQNLNFEFRDCISCKMLHDNRTEFYKIHQFLEGQKNQSLYATKMYMLETLYITKEFIDMQLEDSYHALNESIHVAKGPYYEALHPDNKYVINIKWTSHEFVSNKMMKIWIDWPRASMKYKEPVSYWEKCHGILRHLWNIELGKSLTHPLVIFLIVLIMLRF